ncbi:hypothetical protein N9917_00465 [Deltaproteobacteria bacterium]|nr:hypothetical protein [Deltaproteobacteria bacterium]
MNPYPTDDKDLLAEMYEYDLERYGKRKEAERLLQLHDAGLISHATAYDSVLSHTKHDPMELDSVCAAYLALNKPTGKTMPPAKMTPDTAEALEDLWEEMHPATGTPKPTPPQEAVSMSADRVMRALAQDPKLLFDVACRMGATTLAILGPWSEQEEKERDEQSRITRINWVRRFDTQGQAKSYICVSFRKDDHGREVLDKIEWQVYIKQTKPGSSHIVSHHAKGETFSVMEAQREADEAARERGWMLID